MRPLRLAAVLGVAFALAGCGVTSQRRCTTASDCTAPQQCVLGACGAPCSASAPCPSGQGCLVFSSGSYCSAAQSGACTYNSDCPGTLVCVMATCRSQCTSDRDCPAGLRCDGTRCVDLVDAGPG